MDLVAKGGPRASHGVPKLHKVPAYPGTKNAYFPDTPYNDTDFLVPAICGGPGLYIVHFDNPTPPRVAWGDRRPPSKILGIS